MNFRTTLLLLVLAAAGGAAYWYRDALAAKLGYGPPSADATPGTLYILRRIRPESITRVEVAKDGNTVELVRNGKTWNLPGGWATRGPEVQELIDMITGLDSRFEPIPVGGNKDLQPYGLAESQKPVAVTLTVTPPGTEKTQKYRLLFGEPPERSGNPFTRPTYFRLDEQGQVLRTAPGLMRVLARSRDDYRKRQLFPDVERVRVNEPRPTFPGDPEPPPQPAVALVDAKRVTVTGPAGSWALQRRPGAGAARKGGTELTAERLAADWDLAEPVVDRVDPDKLRTVLAAVPEVWVEDVVTGRNVADEATVAGVIGAGGGLGTIVAAAAGGLEELRTLQVENDKRSVGLVLGKVSKTVETKAPPPPPTPFGAPPPPPTPPGKEVYRYAKLAGNPQEFEVKADKLDELFAPLSAVRDARLFRIRPADARRVEIVRPDAQIILTDERDEAAKEDHWKLGTPGANADAGKITELLDRIAELRASGADVIDPTDPLAAKLKPTADGPRLIVELSEPVSDDDKARRPRAVTLRIGKREPDKNRVFVQVDGNPRIDAVGDDFLKLFDRPALAYRGRRVIDVAAKDIAAVTVHRPGERFKLEQKPGAWKLNPPGTDKLVDVDVPKTTNLVNDLSRLEVSEFVNDKPTPEELAKFGLSAPRLSAMLTFADAKQPPKTVLLGGPREGKPEVYAKLADSPGVFVVRDTIKTAIDQPSLAYRPAQLWQIAPPAVTAIEVDRGGEKHRLSRDGGKWKLTGPFDAPASAELATALVNQVAAPRAERYEAHTAGGAAKYGLNKPAVRLTVFATGMEPKTLSIGKPAADGKSLFAKPADSDAVVVVPAALAAAADRPALDLIDPNLLGLNVNLIDAARGTGPGGNWELKDESGWKVTSLTPPAPADRDAVFGLLRPWAKLRAERFAAYGQQTDWVKFGLEKPAATVTVTAPSLNGGAAESHTLALGGVDPKDGGHYARLDNGPGVAVLAAAVAKDLTRSALDFVDRKLLAFAADDLVGIRRTGPAGELELTKTDDGWQIVKPAAHRADQPMMEELVAQLENLRAERVTALNVTDFKPFGLDAPAATVALLLKDKSEKILHVGEAAPQNHGERYARLDGQSTVVVLPAAVAKTLVAEPIKFRDRAIARFDDADRAFVEYGPRHVTFARVDGDWKMTEPVGADAEAADFEKLLKLVSRLRADELVVEKPADLKPFGLDQPEAKWRVLSGEREVLNLLIGKRDPATGRNYAMLSGGDIVFFLSPDVSNKLLFEYRKRSPWTGLEVAAVESMTITAGEKTIGERTVVLQKAANGWQVPGKPEQKVNAAVADEMLAAIAGLKVERYVADKGADLKQHGLEPPRWTIVVRTSTGGTFTLQLGKTEDGSKRVFGHVPEPNRSDVFVLSEADSRRLTKELQELMK